MMERFRPQRTLHQVRLRYSADMKRSWTSHLLVLALILTANRALAQSSLEMLQRDLDDFKTEHQQAETKNLDYFFSSLQAAEDSPAAAEKLYADAGGKPPARARVMTHYEHETPTEESARTALDQAAMSSFDSTLQMHCGMMHFAALFVTQPKLSSLKGDWLAWLKNASQAYPQVVATVKDPRRAGKDDDENASPDISAQIRGTAMNASMIGDYLGFQGWGDKDEGKWRVADLPELYHDQILQPLRQPPSQAALGAWDIYIAMMNADQPDAEKWTDIDYPALQFEKACDDFASAPSTDKLQSLVTLMKAHPRHPKIDDWIKRVHDMIQGYQAQRNGGAASSTSAGTSGPGLGPVPPDQPAPPAVSTPTK